MSWFHLGSNLKSIAELDSLVNDVLLHEDFDSLHLKGFSAAKENKRLDDAVNAVPGEPPTGWKTGSVKIKLPASKVCIAEDDAAEFEITGIIYRPLLDVMVEAFQGPAFNQFHITPFESRWDPEYDPANPTVPMVDATVPIDDTALPPLPENHQNLYGEIYTSPSMLREHNSLPQTATPHLETIIAAYMFWSDSTHLANFGTASLWPLYTFFGNQSKYTRGKPTANAGYHQAYFPSLPDSIKDFYRNLFNVVPSSDVMAHLKRELMHRIWDLLLTPEFIHAYVHGLVVKCYDGVERRLFPRFFTYGADYPEKVLLATIKYFGGCPCPTCFIEKDQIHLMGTKADMKRRKNIRSDTSWWRQKIELARSWIYAKGILVGGAAVNRLLKPKSWVPTRNAFSKLAEHGFNLFSMFVPDLLHEIELGVVKSLFIHILRILHAVGGDSVAELDKRFRQIPTFGRSTIRRFDSNVSDMKKLAARNFEDILQCLIPVLEGLLPEPHNGIVLSLVFTLATWHAYAKLRMHSSSSIGAFRNVTTEFGVSARHFKRTTCKNYRDATFELPKEQERRGKRDAAKDPNRTTASSAKLKKQKQWNTSTYKYHSMGDYPDAVVRMGTTDSYSTQISECKHKEVKGYYARTNRRNHGRQIANHERRQRLLRAINRRMATAAASEAANAAAAAGESTQPPTPATPSPAAQRTAVADLLQPQEDPLPRTPPRLHHHISESKRSWLDIYEFPALPILQDDPAVQEFLPRLKAHLLSRLLGLPYDGDETEFAPQDLLNVTIMRDRIYTHKVMRVNFTTYDVQRDQDSINPRTHSDIMLLSHEEEDDNPHPYWYARVLGIFHAEVRHVGEKSKSARPIRMEFLWVRWFGRDIHHKAGWATRRLHRVGFVDFASGGAFGFIDPAEVIRGAHLIPAFHYGRTSDLLAESIVRRPDQNNEDFNYYYVNQFVDRDMFMRYSDDAVGHRTSVPSGSVPPTEPIVSNTALDDDDMDVDSESDEPEVEENPVDGPEEDEERNGSDSDKSEWEDEPDENEEEEEEEECAGENGGDGPRGRLDDEDIIDSFGYDAL